MDFPVISGYRIIRRLGPASSVPLYVAEDTRLGRKLTLKVMPSGFSSVAHGRFQNEVRALAALNHPNIASVYDCGWEAGRFYISSEFVEGKSLANLIAMRRVGVFEALEYVLQAARAIAAAHSAGVLHRNIRPENIIVQPGGWVKVIGFGGDPVVRLGREPSETAQGPAYQEGDSSIQHKIHYMSPEEILRFEVDARADVFSLGAVMYELLTGEQAFRGSSIDEVARSVLSKTVSPVTSISSEVSSELEDIVSRALIKQPNQRYQSMEELAAAVAVVLQSGRREPKSGRREPTTDSLVLGGSSSGAESAFVGEGNFFGTAEPQATGYSDFDKLPPLARISATPETFDPTPSRPIYCDENVQFTVYRPGVVRPLVWYDLLAFAHLSERRPDDSESEPDPVEEMEWQARQFLGERLKDYKGTTQDSSAAVPRGDEIRFVPEIDGFEFNPRSKSFRWEEIVHQEKFRMRALQAPDGSVARGQLTVWLGAKILADVNLMVRVDSSVPETKAQMKPTHARPYRKIFASYSRKDTAIVEDFERHALALGDEYLRDQTSIRTGEVWSEKLEEMIRIADVFQLFWSTNSMYSNFVRQEWQYALSLNRPTFVRPTYWQEPMPRDPAKNLPPEELERLQFKRIESAFGAPESASPRYPTYPTDHPSPERDVATPSTPAAPPPPDERATNGFQVPVSSSAPVASGDASSDGESRWTTPRATRTRFPVPSVIGLALLILVVILILQFFC